MNMPPEIRKWLDDHQDDDIVKRAWLLARGRGDRMDMSEHLQDLITMAEKIGTGGKPRREDPKPEVKYVTVNGIEGIAPWNVPENFRHLKRIPKHIDP